MVWTLVDGRCRVCRSRDVPENRSWEGHGCDPDDENYDEYADSRCCLCNGCTFDALAVEIHCDGEGCTHTREQRLDDVFEDGGLYSLDDIASFMQEYDIAENYLCDECRGAERRVDKEKVDIDENKGSTEKTNCEECDHQVDYIQIGLHMKYVCDECGYDASFDSTGEGAENEPEKFGNLYHCHVCNIDSFTEDRFDMEEEMCKVCVQEKWDSEDDEFDKEW